MDSVPDRLCKQTTKSMGCTDNKLDIVQAAHRIGCADSTDKRMYRQETRFVLQTENRIGKTNSKQGRLYGQQRGEAVHNNNQGWFYRKQTLKDVRTSSRIGSTENKQDRLFSVNIVKMLGCIDNKTRLVVCIDMYRLDEQQTG